MRYNGSHCNSLKETAAIRVLRSAKGLPSVEHRQDVLSDVSNLHHSVRHRKNENPVMANRCARKNFSALRSAENGNVLRNNGLGKSRRSNVPCQPLPCTTIGRKRVVGVDGECGGTTLSATDCTTPPHSTRSQEVYTSSPEFETSPRKRPASPSPPSTPVAAKAYESSLPFCEGDENDDDSSLDGLPFDLLVRIVCCLQHDELKPVLQVCGRLRDAVAVARQFHFNFTTPGRGKKEKLGPLNVPLFESPPRDLDVAFYNTSCPRTPNAPRHAPSSPQRKFSEVDVQPFAPPLFQQTSVDFQSSGNFFRKSRSMCRAVPSHRVLFYEDELCQAVAQNTI